MKKDIQNESDIKKLVDLFYERVLSDNVIGFVFTEVNPIVMEEHMPIMYSFWNSVLLGKPGYNGNVMNKHLDLNEKLKLTANHFSHWLFLWEETVAENFEGEKANEAISRAKNIAAVMQFQLNAK